jgi:hypothetical protein
LSKESIANIDAINRETYSPFTANDAEASAIGSAIACKGYLPRPHLRNIINIYSLVLHIENVIYNVMDETHRRKN